MVKDYTIEGINLLGKKEKILFKFVLAVIPLCNTLP
jgi:hypothetical protein